MCPKRAPGSGGTARTSIASEGWAASPMCRAGLGPHELEQRSQGSSPQAQGRLRLSHHQGPSKEVVLNPTAVAASLQHEAQEGGGPASSWSTGVKNLVHWQETQGWTCFVNPKALHTTGHLSSCSPGPDCWLLWGQQLRSLATEVHPAATPVPRGGLPWTGPDP